MKLAPRLFLLSVLMVLLATASETSAWPLGGSWSLEDRLPQPVGNKAVELLTRSDCVVLGKVTSIDKTAFAASQSPYDAHKFAFRVAVVEVKEGIVGAKAGSTLRVGFPVANAEALKERELSVG